MENKDKELIQEPQVEYKKEETPLEVYDIANLKFKCHCCGNEQIIEKDVQGGIRFDLYTTNKHKLVMACSQCKAMLEMSFVKGESSGIVDLEGKPVPKSTATADGVKPEVLESTDFSTVEEEPTDAELEKCTEELPKEVKQEILDAASGSPEVYNTNEENEVTLLEEDTQETSA